jgi:hypothetical protein
MFNIHFMLLFHLSLDQSRGLFPLCSSRKTPYVFPFYRFVPHALPISSLHLFLCTGRPFIPPPRPNCLSLHPILEHPQPVFLLPHDRPSFTLAIEALCPRGLLPDSEANVSSAASCFTSSSSFLSMFFWSVLYSIPEHVISVKVNANRAHRVYFEVSVLPRCDIVTAIDQLPTFRISNIQWCGVVFEKSENRKCVAAKTKTCRDLIFLFKCFFCADRLKYRHFLRIREVYVTDDRRKLFL